MKMAPLVNRPNIGHQEAEFEHEVHSFHKWCEKRPRRGEDARQPLFVKVNNGPIQCEFCGRRVSKKLRQILSRNCVTGRYSEFIEGWEKEVKLTYYSFRRQDLHQEGLKGWHLIQRLLEELK